MEELDIGCPFCGENINILVDPSAGEQQYYEDCSVCCSPILFDLTVNSISGEIDILAKRDDD